MGNSLKLARALWGLEWKGQGLKMAGVALGIALLLFGVTLAAAYIPWILTGPTRTSLEALARNLFEGEDLGNAGLALAFLIVQAPLLLGLLVSYYAAAGLAARLGEEGARGRLELLLAAPFSYREVALGLYLYQLLATLAFYALALVASLGFGLLALWWLQAAPALPPGYWGLLLLAPMGLAVWGGLSALVLALLWPGFARARLGTTGVLPFIASIPGLILLLAVPFGPGDGFSWAFVAATAFGLFGLVLVWPLLGRIFRPELVLG